jgi:chromosome segregation ATPase
MLEQHEIRVEDFKKQADLENERIAQLARTWETDSTQSVILNQFLRLREEKRDSYESAIHLVQESKAVLDYQLAFVKTEYEALEIWAALLTIVFLVFSFYSFYRMDQMREEGGKTVDMIRGDREKMMEEFGSTIDEWEVTKDEWEEDIKKALTGLNSEYRSTIESIDRKIQTVREAIGNEQDRSKQQIASDVSKAKENLNKMITECTDSINKLAKTISGLEQRIDSLEEDNKAIEFYDLYRNQQELEGNSQD